MYPTSLPGNHSLTHAPSEPICCCTSDSRFCNAQPCLVSSGAAAGPTFEARAKWRRKNEWDVDGADHAAAQSRSSTAPKTIGAPTLGKGVNPIQGAKASPSLSTKELYFRGRPRDNGALEDGDPGGNTQAGSSLIYVFLWTEIDVITRSNAFTRSQTSSCSWIKELSFLWSGKLFRVLGVELPVDTDVGRSVYIQPVLAVPADQSWHL